MIRFTGDKPEWRSVPLQPGGTYYIEFNRKKEVHLEAVAYYEGSVDFAPVYSPILHFDPKNLLREDIRIWFSSISRKISEFIE
jgi:hypothetical protein